MAKAKLKEKVTEAKSELDKKQQVTDAVVKPEEQQKLVEDAHSDLNFFYHEKGRLIIHNTFAGGIIFWRIIQTIN